MAALVADDSQTHENMAGALAPKVRKDLERVLKIVAESHVQTEIPTQVSPTMELWTKSLFHYPHLE